MQQQQPAKESLLTVAQIPSLDGGVVTIILTVLAVLVLGAFAYLLVYRWRRRGSTPVPQGERSWREYGSLYVVLWAIGAVIIGFLSVLSLFLLGRFEDVDQALGFLTAFFGAIVGLVGTYFGIKTSADATAGAQKLAATNGGDTTQPRVLSIAPPDQAVDVLPDIQPTATFSKDMDPATISPTTFNLLDLGTGKQVPPSTPRGVVYNESTKVATFAPADPLQNGTRYGATITAGVKDKAGNSLAQDEAWHFKVVDAAAPQDPP
jgi:heme/copper-type cytochrome/quinol oxidase subunit 2